MADRLGHLPAPMTRVRPRPPNNGFAKARKNSRRFVVPATSVKPGYTWDDPAGSCASEEVALVQRKVHDDGEVHLDRLSI